MPWPVVVEPWGRAMGVRPYTAMCHDYDYSQQPCGGPAAVLHNDAFDNLLKLSYQVLIYCLIFQYNHVSNRSETINNLYFFMVHGGAGLLE